MTDLDVDIDDDSVLVAVVVVEIDFVGVIDLDVDFVLLNERDAVRVLDTTLDVCSIRAPDSVL